jgi:hypothetical protein
MLPRNGTIGSTRFTADCFAFLREAAHACA